MAISPFCVACDGADDAPASGSTGQAADSGAGDGIDSSGGEVPDAPATCVPEGDDDVIMFDADYANGTKYCTIAPCPNLDGGCPTPEFAAQTFASDADADAARCILEHLRDRIPGSYAYDDTDNNLFGYRTQLSVFDGGLVIEQVDGSDETTSTFLVRSGELDPPADFSTCLSEGPDAWATCLRGAVLANGVTPAELSCGGS